MVTLYRSQQFDVERTLASGIATYTLGPLKACIDIRIPLWIGQRLQAYEIRQQQRREDRLLTKGIT